MPPPHHCAPADNECVQGELQGRQQASKALGAGRLAAGIVKNEGLKGLYAGLGPAVVSGEIEAHMICVSGSAVVTKKEKNINMGSERSPHQLRRRSHIGLKTV
eukprot:459035-Pelagomonas_calceolata.AAC.2